jgi:hypothetical protein
MITAQPTHLKRRTAAAAIHRSATAQLRKELGLARPVSASNNSELQPPDKETKEPE